jgi:DNA-binding response OmpR family regulator
MLDHHAPSDTAGAIAHRILIVESDQEEREKLRNEMRERGYLVQTAKDGGQAHSAFAMYKPDCVILSLILPGETGFEICERMKQQNESVPVIVYTEITMEDARSLASRVGADGYITKPCTMNILLDQIQEVAQQVWERTHLNQPREEKRIRFSCHCGKRFKVSPVHKGRTLTCPDCGEPITVPHHI